MKINNHFLIPIVTGVSMLPTSAAMLLYTSGHGDMGIAYDAGALDPHVHIHDGSVVDGMTINNPPDGMEYAPDEILTLVADPSTPRAAGTQWAFIGSPVSSPVWVLPQNQDPDRPFYGVASEELDPADWTSLSFSLVTMAAPAGGNFSFYDTDGFGTPTVRFATSDGIDGADSWLLNVGGHDHANFAFTEPGIYALTFTVDGVHVLDGAKTATATYYFSVAPVPEPASALLTLPLLGLLARRRRATA